MSDEPELTKPHVILRTVKMRAPCFFDPRIEVLYGADFMLRFVLVQGAIGDYTCYMGIGPAEFVRDHGNKVSFEMANAVFAGITRERYRE